MLSTVPQLLLALMRGEPAQPQAARADLVRVGVLLPYITPVAASTLVFAVVFARDNGMANWVLSLVGFGVDEPIDWRADKWSSWIAIATMVNWKWIGYNALLYLAAMQSIPQGPLRGGGRRRRRPVEAALADHRADDPAGRDLHGGAVDHRRPAAVHRADAVRREPGGGHRRLATASGRPSPS